MQQQHRSSLAPLARLAAKTLNYSPRCRADASASSRNIQRLRTCKNSSGSLWDDHACVRLVDRDIPQVGIKSQPGAINVCASQEERERERKKKVLRL